MNNSCLHCSQPTGSKSNWCNNPECQQAKNLEHAAANQIRSEQTFVKITALSPQAQEVIKKYRK